MLKIRTIFFSILLLIGVAAGSYFAVLAKPATSASTAPVSENSCPARPASLSTQDLWKILNGRYERRVNLPW